MNISAPPFIPKGQVHPNYNAPVPLNLRLHALNFYQGDITDISRWIQICHLSQISSVPKRYFKRNDSFVIVQVIDQSSTNLHIEINDKIISFRISHRPYELNTEEASSKEIETKKKLMKQELQTALRANDHDFAEINKKIDSFQKEVFIDGTYIIEEAGHVLYMEKLCNHTFVYQPDKSYRRYILSLYDLQKCPRNLVIDQDREHKLVSYIHANWGKLFELAKRETGGCLYIYRRKNYPDLAGKPPVTLAIDSVTNRILAKYHLLLRTGYKKLDVYKDIENASKRIVSTPKMETVQQCEIAINEANNFNVLRGLPGVVNLFANTVIITSHGVKYKTMMEFFDLLDLNHYLKKHDINNELKFKFFKEIARGYQSIHSKRIVYGDGKLENYFVRTGADGKPEVAIGDFGFSFPEGSNKLLGTPGYIAPEIVDFRLGINNALLTSKCDIWTMSFIFLVFEDFNTAKEFIVLQQEVFNKKSGLDLRLEKLKKYNTDIKKLADQYRGQSISSLKYLIGTGLQMNPIERPTSTQILESLEKIESGASINDLKAFLGLNGTTN